MLSQLPRAQGSPGDLWRCTGSRQLNCLISNKFYSGICAAGYTVRSQVLPSHLLSPPTFIYGV